MKERGIKMRKFLLTIVPAMAIMAAPAFAQSSVSSESTTTTTGTVTAPVVGEATTKKVYKSETNGPDGSSETKSVKRMTTNGLGETSEMSKSEHHSDVQGSDGSRSESSSTVTQTRPN
jgi:hypothetical protein